MCTILHLISFFLQTRGYDGNAGGIVRFKCPHGTLRASNFPNARDSKITNARDSKIR